MPAGHFFAHEKAAKRPTAGAEANPRNSRLVVISVVSASIGRYLVQAAPGSGMGSGEEVDPASCLGNAFVGSACSSPVMDWRARRRVLSTASSAPLSTGAPLADTPPSTEQSRGNDGMHGGRATWEVQPGDRSGKQADVENVPF